MEAPEPRFAITSSNQSSGASLGSSSAVSSRLPRLPSTAPALHASKDGHAPPPPQPTPLSYALVTSLTSCKCLGRNQQLDSPN
eukprot:9479566-Pyramimonas_sp.AAC.1